jgi:diguanylate cyclase (GGDEF)-like protein
MSEILAVVLSSCLGRVFIPSVRRVRWLYASEHQNYPKADCLHNKLGYPKSEQLPAAQGGTLNTLQFGLIRAVISVLNTLPKAAVMGISLVLILMLGLIDASLPVPASLLIFYLIPVVIATWFVGVRPGFLSALLSAITIFYGQFTPSQQLTLSLWNGGMAGLAGCVVADLIHRIKISSEIERQLSRTDASTGAINRRFFMELLETEFNRAERYRFPLTLVYIELDNFADLSQRLGYQKGDELLYQFVEQLSETLRANDVVARLSNDEFAMILPQTNDTQAQQVFARILPELKTVLEAEDSPIECIFGVTTFLEMPEDYITVNDEAAKLLKKIKASGQSRLAFQVKPE